MATHCLEKPIDRGAWWAAGRTWQPWGRKQSDTTKRLRTEIVHFISQMPGLELSELVALGCKGGWGM